MNRTESWLVLLEMIVSAVSVVVFGRGNDRSGQKTSEKRQFVHLFLLHLYLFLFNAVIVVFFDCSLYTFNFSFGFDSVYSVTSLGIHLQRLSHWSPP